MIDKEPHTPSDSPMFGGTSEMILGALAIATLVAVAVSMVLTALSS
ncbi:MAG TPA: hypothetical protein VNC39_01500 [Acidocella sp.]|nr:hypothetical protein [Acidocella sp.]HVE20625.1 hypothetical protein [Acidocella sp.]